MCQFVPFGEEGGANTLMLSAPARPLNKRVDSVMLGRKTLNFMVGGFGAVRSDAVVYLVS